jgi:hypothetical protein
MWRLQGIFDAAQAVQDSRKRARRAVALAKSFWSKDLELCSWSSFPCGIVAVNVNFD